MLKTLMLGLLILAPGAAAPPLEPSGVRLSGAIPPVQGNPAPPDWVRLDSHVLADPDCRHYGYEVYAAEAGWLVRYVMFPEDREGFREIEQVFLYPRERGRAKVLSIPPAELLVEPQSAQWKGRIFRLVDRRDLVRD